MVVTPSSRGTHGSSLPLHGQVAFVTGSGRGLGRTIAEKLMSLGADIVLHDISEEAPARFGEVESLSALAKLLKAGGANTAAVTGDITDSAAVERMVMAAQEQLGPVSVLVNCAGGDIGADGNKPNPSTPTNFKLEDVHAVLNRNLIGTMLMSRAIAPGMMKREAGSIINVASILAHQGSAIEIGYACAKAAIAHYTRCLALELRTSGVRANVVSPGPAKTARFLATRTTDPAMLEDGPSLQRYAAPAEIADAVSFFAGPDSRYVSGQVMRIDGAAGLYAA
ncbi:3-oxoacyl-ACP reductase [Steroidobacter agaridevorans]|uniref:3-oxoacyl-ACP reductase n=1 Tax=Steroidobacter agaridevorans TaxID=2695856 RepID=A0A829YL15_9GAMM|nr:SDR family oxidoreductase [Steroidobacter agaridevorans]GFE83438.1 3-oxoacyl-ACP reductase [Steroidobacter agaridevorans]GFE86681.1 3-oxoacyl-ACP reductase [Steroidobacter agaridevorans]